MPEAADGPANIVQFDCFEVDLAAGRLYKRGSHIKLREKSFQVLAALLERPGEVVTREDLRRRLWPDDVFVDVENNLNTTIARLREALGDAAEHPRFIETLPKHGYRFLGKIVSTSSRWNGTARMRTSDVLAYNEYIKGRHEMATATPEAISRALRHFERAIARDPHFVLPYDALAEAYWYVGYFGFAEPKEAFQKGVLFAIRALEIDNTLAETHALLGQYHKQLHYDWVEVEREMTRALQLDPSSPLVRIRYAFNFLMPHARFEEACRELGRALELDPLSSYAHTTLAATLLLWRKYDRAIDQARVVLELDPGAYWGHSIIASCRREQHRFDEAIAAQRLAMDLSGHSSIMAGWLGLVLGQAGQIDEARALLARLHARAGTGYVSPASLAWIYLGLNQIDDAFMWLERAVDGLDQIVMPIKSYGFLDPIRSDPRFDALLRKMNLS